MPAELAPGFLASTTDVHKRRARGRRAGGRADAPHRTPSCSRLVASAWNSTMTAAKPTTPRGSGFPPGKVRRPLFVLRQPRTGRTGKLTPDWPHGCEGRGLPTRSAVHGRLFHLGHTQLRQPAEGAALPHRMGRGVAQDDQAQCGPTLAGPRAAHVRAAGQAKRPVTYLLFEPTWTFRLSTRTRPGPGRLAALVPTASCEPCLKPQSTSKSSAGRR